LRGITHGTERVCHERANQFQSVSITRTWGSFAGLLQRSCFSSRFPDDLPQAPNHPAGSPSNSESVARFWGAA
jgi:hypothetical protein